MGNIVIINDNALSIDINIIGFDATRSAIVYHNVANSSQLREMARDIKKRNAKFQYELDIPGIPNYAKYTASTRCYKMIQLNDVVDFWKPII